MGVLKYYDGSSWQPIITGAQGVQGTTGLQGAQGTTGIQGFTGTQGTQGIQGSGYNIPTSTTSATIGLGSKGPFTVTLTGSYVVGDRVRVANTANTANYMEGAITALVANTSITVNVDNIGGTGTLASWNFGIAGIQGVQGVQGTQGITGLGYNGVTSATSNVIGTGTKTFSGITLTGAYVIGDYVRVVNTGSSTNYMIGTITALTNNSSITINSLYTGGTGTFTAWTFSIEGVQGMQGTTGLQGFEGLQGLQGTYGFQGLTGNQGLDGLYAAQGVQGPVGPAGGITVSYHTQAADSATPLVLTNSFATNIRITEGSPTGFQEIQLPVASTMTVGQYFEITNDMTTSLNNVYVYLNGGNTTQVIQILPYATSRITCILASGTTTASWEASQTGLGYLSNASNVPAIYGLDTVSSTFGAYLFENNSTGQIAIGANTQTGGEIQIGNPNGTGNVVLDGGSINLNTTANTSTINIGNSNSTTNFTGTVTGLPATNLGYTTTATSATLVTLTAASTRRQVFTGSTAQNVNLPVASTLTVGDAFYIINDSSAVVTVRSSGANTILAQPAGTMVQYYCILASGTTTASWGDTYNGFNTITGTGNNVLATSPTLTTPVIDSPQAASATSTTTTDLYNNITSGYIRIGSGITSGRVNLAESTTFAGQINIASASTSAHTTNISTGATLNTVTKAVNIGTNGVAGSTTNIIIGSATGTSTTNILGTAQVGGSAILTAASTASALTSFGTNATLTTPTINAINASAAGTAATLWDTTLTNGSISIGSALTGNMTVANATGFAGTIAIANASTSAHTISISNGAGTTNKTINIGTASTGGTTAIALGSSSGATSTIALNGKTTLSAGTATAAPLNLTSGTNLTNAAAGAIEYDGNAGYFTTNVTHGRGGLATLTLASSTATKSLTSATTANQPLFATPTTGALTVAAATTYLVDALIFLNMGTTTSRTVSFSLIGGGTATITSTAFETSYVTGASGTLATPQNTWWTSATGGVMNASSTTSTAYFRVKGIIRINASGTIIPAITFSAAPGGTNTVGINSFFTLTPIGSNTATTIGAWA